MFVFVISYNIRRSYQLIFIASNPPQTPNQCATSLYFQCVTGEISPKSFMDDHKSTVSGTVSTEPPPSDLALLPPSVGFKEPQTNIHSSGQQLRQIRSKPTGNSFPASIREKAVTLLQPDRKIGPSPSLWKSIRSIILASCEFRVHLCTLSFIHTF